MSKGADANKVNTTTQPSPRNESVATRIAQGAIRGSEEINKSTKSFFYHSAALEGVSIPPNPQTAIRLESFASKFRNSNSK